MRSFLDPENSRGSNTLKSLKIDIFGSFYAILDQKRQKIEEKMHFLKRIFMLVENLSVSISRKWQKLTKKLIKSHF